MSAFQFDIGIGGVINLINDTLARRHADRALVWDSLRSELEVVRQVTTELDDIYIAILIETKAIFREPEPSPDRLSQVIYQARSYCITPELLMVLDQLQGDIEAVAFHSKLEHRKYRDIVTTLRSIADNLGTYIARVRHLHTQDTRPLRQALNHRFQTGDTRPLNEYVRRRWNLRHLLELLDLIWELSGNGVDITDLRARKDLCEEASEEAIRNFNYSMTETLSRLAGQAQRQIMLLSL
jgi:hypothetical protein